MRTTLSIIFAILVSSQSHAGDTFEMALPDEVSQPNSSGFVNSYENDLGKKKNPDNYVVTSYEEKAPSPTRVEEEQPQGAYSSAFSSFRSKKSSEAAEQESADAWRKGQEKRDSFDIDNMSFAETPSRDEHFAMPARQYEQPAPAKSARNSRKLSRSPASEDVPLPQGSDLGKELDAALDSKPSSSSKSSSGSQDISAGGGISAKERKSLIMRTIADNYRDLKTCYNDGLKKNSEMKGKVTMGWAMDAQGRVLGAEVQTSQLGNKQVEKCMVDRLSGWRFPSQAKLSGAKDRMTYTFQFVPERD